MSWIGEWGLYAALPADWHRLQRCHINRLPPIWRTKSSKRGCNPLPTPPTPQTQSSQLQFQYQFDLWNLFKEESSPWNLADPPRISRRSEAVGAGRPPDRPAARPPGRKSDSISKTATIIIIGNNPGIGSVKEAPENKFQSIPINSINQTSIEKQIIKRNRRGSMITITMSSTWWK